MDVPTRIVLRRSSSSRLRLLPHGPGSRIRGHLGGRRGYPQSDLGQAGEGQWGRGRTLGAIPWPGSESGGLVVLRSTPTEWGRETTQSSSSETRPVPYVP